MVQVPRRTQSHETNNFLRRTALRHRNGICPRRARKVCGPYAVEYYYKVKWGHSEEFLTLFKKNHYPLLKKGVESGEC